jgi:hypothetical protein
MRSRWRLSLWTLVALVFVVGLAAPGQAAATYLTPSDAFYWNLPAVNGNPNDQQGAIATSPDGSLVYVADKYGNYVEEYTSDGTYQREYRSRTLSSPTGVTTDLSGNVYVVYEAQGVVAKFTAGLKLVSTWSVPFAKSIAADRAGDLWVLTNFLNAVGEFDSNGKSMAASSRTSPGNTTTSPAMTRRTRRSPRRSPSTGRGGRSSSASPTSRSRTPSPTAIL